MLQVSPTISSNAPGIPNKRVYKLLNHKKIMSQHKYATLFFFNNSKIPIPIIKAGKGNTTSFTPSSDRRSNVLNLLLTYISIVLLKLRQ